MRFRVLLLCTLLLPVSACAHVSEPMATWGKPGVSFADYRTDSVDCAITGATVPIKETDEYSEIDRGLKTQQRTLENPPPGSDQFDQIRDYSMTYQRNIRANIGDIQSLMVRRVQICLRSKGYKEFLLTPEQEAELGRYVKGSDARFRYLHSIASNPANIPPDLPASFDQ